MTKYKVAVVVFVLLFISAITSQFQQKPKVMGEIVQYEVMPTLTITLTATATVTPTITAIPTTARQLYKIIKVIDGDTITINLNGKDETVRIIGIDTPELVDPRKPVQCFALEASNKAKSVLSDQFVFLETDPTQTEKDKYNRLLRYVFLQNGADFGKMMIEEGYAHEYTYETPYKYQEEYKKMEKQAREAKRGLWADSAACGTPTLTPTSPTPVEQIQNNGGFTCNCSKTCEEISSCQEAYYQLKNCGCSKRDQNSDGVPCENICK